MKISPINNQSYRYKSFKGNYSKYFFTERYYGKKSPKDAYESGISSAKNLEDSFKSLNEKIAILNKQKLMPQNKSELTQDLLDFAKQCEYVNDILNSSNPDSFEADKGILEKYLIRMNALKKEEGFNCIVGHDKVKEYLMDEFVFKTIARAKTSQKTEVPNAFLLYGPPGCGKTIFAKALAQQALCHVKNLDAGSMTPQEALETLKQLAQEAKEKYENDEDKTRTIIVINEFDYIANAYSPVAQDLCEFMKNCADEYKCTLFLTTNHPLMIDENILDEKITPSKIVIDKPDYETSLKLLTKQLNALSKSKNLAPEVAQILFKNENGYYSCADIVALVTTAHKIYENPTIENYIDILKEDIPPSIKHRTITKFEAEKNKLGSCV